MFHLYWVKILVFVALMFSFVSFSGLLLLGFVVVCTCHFAMCLYKAFGRYL